MNREALELLVCRPAQVARWCGLTLLTDDLHGAWMHEMIAGREDMTLLAHRGSYKTSCLAMAMAVTMLVHPTRNMIFLRKTDGDVVEIIRLVRRLLESDALRCLSARLWGEPVSVVRGDQFSLTGSCYAACRGAAQLLGQGVKGSLTGKHANLVITDDIVNLQDRLSPQERAHTRTVYQELQNIRIPGGRILNTGTPWHPEDAISLMPRVRRYDCRRTGLLSPPQLEALRQSMSPSLFAANYELRHLPEEGVLFCGAPRFTQDASLLRDGLAHVDAAYGGSDMTALTCARLQGDTAYLYGRLFPGHVDGAMDAIVADCTRLLCGPIYCETNGDKGYVARELRRRGAQVRTYQERQNKHLKIATHLRRWWPRLCFLSGTDQAYVDQILGYSELSPHDDAPDSAASILRILDAPGACRT